MMLTLKNQNDGNIHKLQTSRHRYTTLHTAHHKHTTLSPHRRCKRTLHFMALLHLWPQRKKLIADAITNSDHITLNTNTPTRRPNTTLQQTSSPDITTVSNTLYHRTSWTTQHTLSSEHLTINTTMNIRYDYGLPQNRRTFTNYKKADWTQSTEDTRVRFRSDHHTHQYTHCQHNFHKHHND